MSSIIVDSNAFIVAKAKQQIAANKLREQHDVLQAALGNLASSWSGKGGDAFLACSKALTSQTLMGILMISVLSSQTNAAQGAFIQSDAYIAAGL